MKKRIIALVSALILLAYFTGCGGPAEDPVSAEFRNDVISFSYPKEYTPTGKVSEGDPYRIFGLKDTDKFYFVYDLLPAQGYSAEQRKNEIKKDFYDPDNGYIFDSEEKITVDGKEAWIVNFGTSDHRVSFWIIDYSAGFTVQFSFLLPDDGNADQISKEIMESVRFQ